MCKSQWDANWSIKLEPCYYFIPKVLMLFDVNGCLVELYIIVATDFKYIIYVLVYI